jgi:uncharacterized delta-60 repeat protein
MITRFTVFGLIAVWLGVLVPGAGAAVTVDSAFGHRGVLVPRLYPKSKYNEEARGVAVQADGKMIVPFALSFSYGHRERRPLVRFNADGTRDSTYGHKGVAWLRAGGAPYLTIRGVTTAADESTLVWGEYGFKSLADYEGSFVAQVSRDGVVDKSFGSSGAARFRFTRNEGELMDVSPATDGGVIVSYLTYSHKKRYRLKIARLSPGGSRDRRFGANGTRVIRARNDELVNDVAVSGNSAFVLLSRAGQKRCAVRKYELAGAVSLDASFGRGGTAVAGVVPALTGDRYCETLTTTAAGGVLIAGGELTQGEAVAAANAPPELPPEFTIPKDPEPQPGFVQRLTAAGNPDLAFGSGGAIVFESGSDLPLLLELPGGGVLTNTGDSSQFPWLSAFDASGARLPSFGAPLDEDLATTASPMVLAIRGGVIAVLVWGSDEHGQLYSRIVRVTT